MNKDIKQKWLDALKSDKFIPIGHKLRCSEKQCCPMGVLCQLHSEATNTKWDESVYLGRISSAPDEVLKWADIKPSDQSLIIVANNQLTSGKRTYDSAIQIIETL